MVYSEISYCDSFSSANFISGKTLVLELYSRILSFNQIDPFSASITLI